MKKLVILTAAVFLAAHNLFSEPVWLQQPSPVVTDLYCAWAVSCSICWMCGPPLNQSVVIRTTNGGSNWIMLGSGIPPTSGLYCIYAFDENNCWVGSEDGSLWHTASGGTNWTHVILSPNAGFIDAIYFFDMDNGFVLGDPVNNIWSYYVTTNGGNNWMLAPNAPAAETDEAGWNSSFCALDTGHIWWGTNSNKIWRGSFRGTFFAAPTPLSPWSMGVAFNDIWNGTAIINSSSTFYSNLRSSDGGYSWSESGFVPYYPYTLKGVPGTQYMWMGTVNTVERSTDNGLIFSTQIALPSNTAVLAMSMYSINCGWVGTQGGKIYRYIDDVGINDPGAIPVKYELKQNYPNPFNPQTTINYSLAKAGHVTLKIYNMLGQEIYTLADGFETAGEHSVLFNASNLPSGTYFYMMSSRDPVSGTGQVYTATKKMVLIK
jgi:Secretion system C-terminal sorting domain